MIYCFTCPLHGPFEVRTSVINPESATCECTHLSERDLYMEMSSQGVAPDDPFRKAWLSDATRSNLQAQGRPMDSTAPKDKFEAKHIERVTGRQYIGNDISMLKPEVQKAILKGQREKLYNRDGL